MSIIARRALIFATLTITFALPLTSRGGDSSPLLSQLTILNGRLGIGLNYTFTVDNAELSPVKNPCPYENTYIAQELYPYLRFTLFKDDADFLEFRPGLRLEHIFGGDINIYPRIQMELASDHHHLLLGHFRPHLHPLFLDFKAENPDWPGADYTLSNNLLSFELLCARTQVPLDKTYETIPLASRLTLAYQDLFSLSALVSALHQAGHDAGGTGFTPPEPSKREFFCFGGTASISLLKPFTGKNSAAQKSSPPQGFWGGKLNDLRINGAIAYGEERKVEGGLAWSAGVETRWFNFLGISGNYYFLEGSFVSPLAHDELKGSSIYWPEGWELSSPGNYPDQEYINLIISGDLKFLDNITLNSSVEQGYHYAKDGTGRRHLYSYNRFIAKLIISL